jgi:hypothetical protein
MAGKQSPKIHFIPPASKHSQQQHDVHPQESLTKRKKERRRRMEFLFLIKEQVVKKMSTYP